MQTTNNKLKESIDNLRKNKNYILLFDKNNKVTPLSYSINSWSNIIDFKISSSMPGEHKKIMIFQEQLDLRKFFMFNKEDIFRYNPSVKKYTKEYRRYQTTNALHYKKLSKEIEITYLSDKKEFKDKDGNVHYFWLADIKVPKSYNFHKQ